MISTHHATFGTIEKPFRLLVTYIFLVRDLAVSSYPANFALSASLLKIDQDSECALGLNYGRWKNIVIG